MNKLNHSRLIHCMQSELCNVFLLGLSMLFITGANACAFLVQEITLDNAGQQKNISMKGLGYASLSIASGSMAISSWFTQVFENILGAKYCMCVASLLSAFNVASFINPIPWIVYLSSVGLGLASALIWNCQASYLNIVSNKFTISRNAGLVWVLFAISMLVGNLLQYFIFNGKTLNVKDITIFYALLFGSIGVGLVTLIMLKNVKKSDKMISEEETEILISQEFGSSKGNSLDKNEAVNYSTLEIFKRSIQIIFTLDVAILMPLFLFMGFQANFITVLTSCVGRTKHFGVDAFSYIGLVGIARGVGEIFGSIGATKLAQYFRESGRSIAIVIASCGQFVEYFIAFLVLPSDSPYQDSIKETYITPHLAWILLCGFLIGVGNSAFTTQVLTFLCNHFSMNDFLCVYAQSCFIGCISNMIMFTYAGVMSLPWQLFIISIFCFLATLAFISLDMKLLKRWQRPVVVVEISSLTNSKKT